MNKKFTRLTALLLAMLLLMSTFSTALADTTLTRGEYNQALTQMQEDLNLIPENVPAGIEADPVKVTGTTLVPVTTPVDGKLMVGGSIDLTPETTAEGYQWQIAIDGTWANIAGETGESLKLTYTMAVNALTVDAETGATTVKVRRLHYDEIGVLLETCDEIIVPVNTEPVYKSEDTESWLDVTEYTQITEDEQQKFDAAWAFQDAANGRVSTFALMPAAEDDGRTTYNLIISYELHGEDVANTYSATLAKDSSFNATAQHPIVQGYVPTQGSADGWNVEGITYTDTETQINLTNIQQDINLLVTYQPAEVEYTVIHNWQNVENDAYTVHETEKLKGLTESYVSTTVEGQYSNPEVANEYPGFYALLYDKPQIAADGTTVVEVYYDRNYYLMLFNLGDGGYGVEPVYARYGAALDNVNAPTRAGYEFMGWSLDGTTLATLPDTMPAENVTYTALWKMNDEATVTLAFWGENADDTGYSPLPSMSITTTPGTQFTYSESGSLICGKEAHTHSAACGYDCGYEEHSHSLADNCYTLTCTESTHNHVNDGCTLNCKHEHELACYTTSNGTLESTTKPDESLTDSGNGIYTYVTREYIFIVPYNQTHYYLNIEGNWYTSSRGDTNTISLNCSHSHGNECYTCGQANSAHVHTIDGGCYTLTCQIPVHSHTVECYACGKTAHSHTSGCYLAGAGLDSNLWVFEKSDTVTVAADGSSVVNVYYKRTTKTLTFKYNYSDGSFGTTKTITAKWGEDISDEYVKIADDCGSTFWSKSTNGNGPYTNYFGIMPQTSATYYHRSANGSNGSMMYYGQDLSGDYSVKLFQVDNVGGYYVSDEDRYEFEGFTYHHGTSNKSSCSGATFYYTRNTYDIEFYNPTELIHKAENVYYEAPLGSYDFTPTADQAPDSYEPGSVEFDGWYLNPECTGEQYILANHTMPVGAVNGDVALKLYAKWKPVNRTVSFYLNKDEYDAGVSSITETHPTQTVPHGSKIGTVPAKPDNGDYTFVGWFYMDGDKEKAFDFTNMTVTKNLKVYAKWSSNVLKEYSVYFKFKTTDENGNPIEVDIADPIIGSTLAGQTKTFDAKGGTELYPIYQEGYFPLVESHSITLDIEDDSKNTYTFYYVQKNAVPYKVYYVAEKLKEGGTSLGTIERDGKTYHIIYGTKEVNDNRRAVVTENFETVSGYMPDAYQKRLIVDGTDGAVNEIIFYYSIDTEHAYYKINHFTEELDGTWTEYASSQAIGDIGKEYTADPMTISGFTYSKTEYEVNDEVTTDNKLTDKGLEINLYYTRNSYPYVVYYKELVSGKELANSKTGTGEYQQVIREGAIDIDNYTAVDPTSQTLTIKIDEGEGAPNLNVLTFYYEENSVPITYKVVGPDDCGTVDIIDGETKRVREDSENVKILSGTALGANAEANTPSFKFVGWFKDEDCTQSVDASWVTNSSDVGAEIKPQKENGKNAAATYYAKFVEKEVTINYEVVGPDGCGTVDPEQETLKILTGEAKGSTAEAVTPTYKFVGWYSDVACEELLSEDPYFKPTKDAGTLWKNGTTYYAKFEWNLGSLTITKAGMDAGDSAIFDVYIDEELYTTVVLTDDNNYTVTLSGLTAEASYNVRENGNWSWRYSLDSEKSKDTTGKIPGGDTAKATFVNTKSNDHWLSDESSVKNVLKNSN